MNGWHLNYFVYVDAIEPEKKKKLKKEKSLWNEKKRQRIRTRINDSIFYL